MSVAEPVSSIITARTVLRSLVLLVLGFLHVSCVIGGPQSCVIREYTSVEFDRGETAVPEVRVAFYPDGLIHTYRASYPKHDGKAEQVIRSFEITRRGNQILPKYSVEGQGYRVESIEIRPEVTLVRFSIPNAGDYWELRPTQGAGSGSKAFKFMYMGKVYALFDFSEHNTEYEVLSTGASCLYSAPRDGVPVFSARNADNSVYAVDRTAEGRTRIDWKTHDGLSLWIYVVEGTPFHADPLTAIVNEELLGGVNPGPAFSSIVFPYVGGLPN